MTDSASPDVPEVEPAEGAGRTPTVSGECSHCGEARRGAFCHECGQRYQDERLTLGRLWRDFVSRAFSLDHGLLHTLRQLATGPGRVPSAVVVGRSRAYTHPLSFYFLVSAISLFSAGLYAEDLIEAGMSSTAASVEIDDGAAEEDVDRDPRAERLRQALDEIEGEDGTGIARRVTEIMRRLNTPLLFLFALLAVLPLRLVFGRQRNLAETAVFSLYVVGFATLVVSILSPPIVWLSGVATGAILVSLLTVVAYGGILAWGAASFWRPGWRTVVKAVVASVLAYVAYSFVSGLVAILILFGDVLADAELGWTDLLSL
ncbi:MAG: DUF3667 domain-containing protein [Bacteroidota bacterium]